MPVDTQVCVTETSLVKRPSACVIGIKGTRLAAAVAVAAGVTAADLIAPTARTKAETRPGVGISERTALRADA